MSIPTIAVLALCATLGAALGVGLVVGLAVIAPGLALRRERSM